MTRAIPRVPHCKSGFSFVYARGCPLCLVISLHSFRTDLNDYLCFDFFLCRHCFRFMFTRVFLCSHRRLLNPILCIGAAGAVIAFCIVSSRSSPTFATVSDERSFLSSLPSLVAVLGLLSAWLLKIGPLVLFLHPVINLLFCITLIIVETFLASWASIDASLAIVIPVGSLFVFCIAPYAFFRC